LVRVGVAVRVGVSVGVGVSEGVGVSVSVGVSVTVGVRVLVAVCVWVGVLVFVLVGRLASASWGSERATRKSSIIPRRVDVRWKDGQAKLMNGVTKGWLKSTETIITPPGVPESSFGVQLE
jgi:hypothetical protein